MTNIYISISAPAPAATSHLSDTIAARSTLASLLQRPITIFFAETHDVFNVFAADRLLSNIQII